MIGRRGAEQFRGQGGNDQIDGRGGTRDEADYRNAPSGTVADMSGGAIGEGTVQDGYGSIDTLTNIERIRGSEFDDIITMDDGNNRVRAQAGDDVVEGLGGNDRLEGWLGDDLLRGGDGDDYLDGGVGADLLDGGEGSDFFLAGSGDDFIDGGIDVAGDDFDFVEYGFVDPESSSITYTGGTGINGIAIGDAIVTGVSFGTHALTNIEGVQGTTFDDTLIAGSADETFDFSFGGSDTLVVQQGTGFDTVFDFFAGDSVDDVVDLSALSFNSFAEVHCSLFR